MKTMIAPVPASLAFAEELFTKRVETFSCFGPDKIATVFGVTLEQVPPIPFTEAELRRAHELNQYPILQVQTARNGQPLTMEAIHEQFDNKLGEGKLLYDIDWYRGEAFFTKDTPTLGWKLVSREVIPGSTGVDYIGQTQVLSDYLTGSVFKGEVLPDEYQAAVDEFKTRRAELERLTDKNWAKAAEELASLKLNQLFREKPVEVIYGLVVNLKVNGERNLKSTYTRTNQRLSRGFLVSVGGCDSDGVGVSRDNPRYSSSRLGVRFSRSGIGNLGS